MKQALFAIPKTNNRLKAFTPVEYGRVDFSNKKAVKDKAVELLAGEVAKNTLRDEYGQKVIIDHGQVLTPELLHRIPFALVPFIHVGLTTWLQVMDLYDRYYDQDRRRNADHMKPEKISKLDRKLPNSEEYKSSVA